MPELVRELQPDERRRPGRDALVRQPAVLNAQVTRMLRDPKSFALVENFAGQWLQFKNIDVVRPDLERFPEFDDGLRQAMRRETELFLQSIIHEDRSVLDLLRADDTFLNERLARHYGISGIRGSEFRRVMLTNEERKGLLGKGAVLTVTSYPNRTSPTLRGKWLLENLLGSPPPPPPPNVPSLKEDKDASQLTMRQRMQLHQANAVCASCHSRMASRSLHVTPRAWWRRRRWADSRQLRDRTPGLSSRSSGGHQSRWVISATLTECCT